MIKLIIFDFDGTLINTVKTNLIVQNKIAKKYGYIKLKKNIRLKNETFWQIIHKELKISFFNTFKFIKRFRKELNKEINTSKVYPNIKEILKQLSKKYDIGLLSTNITHKPIKNIKQVLKNNNIKQYFKFIRHANFLIGKKKSLKKILKTNKLNSSEVVYIGDEISDIKTCKKLGIKIIAVSWGFQSKKILEQKQPDYLINKPNEILKILK